jgi:hypothetical protein
MADIKIKSAFNRAITEKVVEGSEVATEVKADILDDNTFLTALGTEASLRASLKTYFDTLYEPQA